VDRPSGLSVRLKLTLSYAGFLMVAGALLIGLVWVLLVRYVENTGNKLSPQVVSTLTEPFQRGTERIRTDHAGVGLGLAIVKSIAQAHAGTLTLTARPAGGLDVTVQLPAQHEQHSRSRDGFS
jgi:two-component system sensor histidine kinase VanS